MMSSNGIIAKLKRAVNEKIFPSDLEKILLNTGFDSETAILEINRDTIKDIESFVNENKQILEQTSYSSLLNDSIDFKLKPGHKAFLLRLPQSLRKYNDNIKKKQSNNLNEIEVEEIEREEGEEGKEENKVKELKEKLIKKLINFAEKNSFGLVLDESFIQNYRCENNQTKCQIKCSICNALFTCYHTSYWNVSNLEKHIKRHFKNTNVNAISDPLQLENIELISHSGDLDDVLSD